MVQKTIRSLCKGFRLIISILIRLFNLKRLTFKLQQLIFIISFIGSLITMQKVETILI